MRTTKLGRTNRTSIMIALAAVVSLIFGLTFASAASAAPKAKENSATVQTYKAKGKLRAVGKVQGRVIDSAKNGLENIAVDVYTAEGGLQSDPVAETTTNAKGRYRLNLPNGCYELRFSNLPSEFISDRRWPFQTDSLCIKNGKKTKPRHVLEKFDASITVVVKSESGTPVSGARVDGPRGTLFTNSSGEATITTLRAGCSSVTLGLSGSATFVEDGSQVLSVPYCIEESEALTVEAAVVDEVKLDGSVRVVVTSKFGGPVPGVRVDGPLGSKLTNSSGEVLFTDHPATCSILTLGLSDNREFLENGQPVITAPFCVENGEDLVVEVLTSEEFAEPDFDGSIRVIVKTKSGEPVSGVRVYGPRGSEVTKSNGEVLFTNHPATCSTLTLDLSSRTVDGGSPIQSIPFCLEDGQDLVLEATTN